MAEQLPIQTIGIDQGSFESWAGDLSGGNASGGGGSSNGKGNVAATRVQKGQGDGEIPRMTRPGAPAQDTSTTQWWVDPIRTGPAVLSTTAAAPLSQAASLAGSDSVVADVPTRVTSSVVEEVTSSALTSSIAEPSRSSSNRTRKHHSAGAAIPTSTYTIGNSLDSSAIHRQPDGLESGTSHGPQQQHPTGGTPIALIVGIAVMVFFVGVAIFLLVLFIRRRKLLRGRDSKKEGNHHRGSRFSTFSSNEKGHTIGDLEGEQMGSRTELTSPAATAHPPHPDSPTSANSIRQAPEMEQVTKSAGDETHLMYHPTLQKIEHMPEIDLSKFATKGDNDSVQSPKTPPLLPDPPTRPTPTRGAKSKAHSHSKSNASGQRSPKKNSSPISFGTMPRGEKSAGEGHHHHHRQRRRSQTANSFGSTKSPRFPSDSTASKSGPASLGPYNIFPKERNMPAMHTVSPITPPPSQPLPASPEGLKRASSTGSIGGAKLKPRSPNILMSINETPSWYCGDENTKHELEQSLIDEEKLQVDDSAERERSSIVSSANSSILNMGIRFKDIKDSPVMSRRLTEKTIRSISSSERSSCLAPAIGDSNSVNISTFEFDLSEVPRESNRYTVNLFEEGRKSRAASSVFSLNPNGQTFYRESGVSNRWPKNCRALSMAITCDGNGDSMTEQPIPEAVTEEGDERKESLESDGSSTEEHFVGTAKQVDVVSLKDSDSRISVTSISRPNSRQTLRMSVESRGVSPRFSAGRSPTPNDEGGRNSQMSVGSEQGRSSTSYGISLAVAPEPLNLPSVTPIPSPLPSPTLAQSTEDANTVSRTLSVKKDRERAYSSSTMKFVDLYRSSRLSHPMFGNPPAVGILGRSASFIPCDPLPALPSPPGFQDSGDNNSPTGVSGLPGSLYQSRPMSIAPAANVRAFREAIQMANLPSLAIEPPTIPERSSSRTDVHPEPLLEEQMMTSPLLLFAPTLQRASVSISMDQLAQARKASIDEIDDHQACSPPKMLRTIPKPLPEEEEEDEEDEGDESCGNTTFNTMISASTSTSPTTSSPPKSPVNIGRKLEAETSQRKTTFDFGEFREMLNSRGW